MKNHNSIFFFYWKTVPFLFQMIHIHPNIRCNYRYQRSCRNKKNNNNVRLLSEFKELALRGVWAEHNRLMNVSLYYALFLYGRGSSLVVEKVSVLILLYTKRQGDGSRGGYSVLEESHVVSESGQLLLVWNQWDWGRICGERRNWVRGVPQRAKHHLSSSVSPRYSWDYKPTCSAFNLKNKNLPTPPCYH